MQHDYREIYGWMAEGKDVQVVMDNWTTCSQEGLLRHMLNGLAPEHFRLKPRTVKIGSREVEAPVLEPEEGEQVYFLSPRDFRDGAMVDSIRFSPKNNPHVVEHMRAKGMLFASAEACEEVHAAFSALLRGEAC